MMKKLGLLLLVLSLGLLPFSTHALYKVDENGNPIEYEEKEGEYHILMDEGQGADGNTSSSDTQPAAPQDKENPDAVTSSDANNASTGEVNPDDASDLATYDTVKTLAESTTNSDKNDNKKIIIYSVGSGVIGMTIGAGLVYFLVKKH